MAMPKHQDMIMAWRPCFLQLNIALAKLSVIACSTGNPAQIFLDAALVILNG